MWSSRVYTADTMRREYKSRKMLFFIVLLFFIIQVVAIIGLAEEENQPELKPDKITVKEKYDFASITAPNPQLTIDAPNYVSPGDELKIVVTSDAKPVGGATVKLLSEITTDEDGTASIEIPISLADMKLILTATKDDFDPCAMLINIGSKEKTGYMTPYIAQPSNGISVLQSFQNTWNIPFLDRLSTFQTGK